MSNKIWVVFLRLSVDTVRSVNIRHCALKSVCIIILHFTDKEGKPTAPLSAFPFRCYLYLCSHLKWTSVQCQGIRGTRGKLEKLYTLFGRSLHNKSLMIPT